MNPLSNGTIPDRLRPPLPQDWVSPPTPNFNRYYLIKGESHGLHIRQIHLQGPSEQTSIKNFREKGPWAHPGTPQFWGVPPIISVTEKATDVKFGRYIYMVQPSKSPLKNFEKRERGRIQVLQNWV